MTGVEEACASWGMQLVLAVLNVVQVVVLAHIASRGTRRRRTDRKSTDG